MASGLVVALEGARESPYAVLETECVRRAPQVGRAATYRSCEPSPGAVRGSPSSAGPVKAS
jgi:hypothetical protein